MKEFIDKLIGRLEERKTIERAFKRSEYSHGVLYGYADAIKTINKLAEEYKGKSNNTFETIYDKVCSLEKKYANDGNVESVNDCIKLENLLQYFKEELQSAEEYNGGWIPCERALPKLGQMCLCSVNKKKYTDTKHDIVLCQYRELFISRWEDWFTAWQPLPAPYTEGE